MGRDTILNPISDRHHHVHYMTNTYRRKEGAKSSTQRVRMCSSRMVGFGVVVVKVKLCCLSHTLLDMLALERYICLFEFHYLMAYMEHKFDFELWS